MKRSLRLIPALAALLILSACGGKKVSSAEPFVPRKFPPAPTAPSMMTDRNEITEYIITNYWNDFLEGDYHCDSSYVNGVASEDVESALGMYVTLLENGCSREFATKAMEGFAGKVEEYGENHPSSNVFSFFEEMVRKYLYDPNSPVRDEDLFLPYVSRLAESKLVSEEKKAGYSFDARMCSLNQVGTKAADFTITDLSGKRYNLYGIEAPYTLLFFTNPGCPSCKEIVESLTRNEEITNLAKNGVIAVVNVYIDLDREKWRALAKEYPDYWYNGYDQDYAIRQDISYNVRGIPSLYVLDEDKWVIMKDAPAEKAIPFLQNIQKQ